MAVYVLEDKLFVLETENTSYSFCLDAQGFLSHLYFGKKIERKEDFFVPDKYSGTNYHPYRDAFMEEFSSFGMMRYKESALKVTFSDGTKDFRYRVSGYDLENNKLSLTLRDAYYPFEIMLCYEIFEENDIIKRFVRAVNRGEEDILLERLYSAELGIGERDMEIINFAGNWGAEFQMSADTLRAGKKIYESLRGTTGHSENPCFILHKGATEDRGDVYFGLLEYTGNFKVCAEAVSYGYTNMLIGISDTDFGVKLGSGECFETPAAYLGFTENGFSCMSHKLHDFCRRELMPETFADKPLRVLYNSWYATLFDVRCEEQKRLAEKAAGVGAELFVVDDGWFGKRNDDNSSLGDWYPDPEKFPGGLQELISYVNGLGMDFGIWIEPEMVNEKSRLYEEHPDWVYRFPNRDVLQCRNQYTLNLTKEEVVRYMIECLDRLLTDYHISYIKWDMNRPLGETGTCGENAACCEGDLAEQKEVWVKHIRNFYRVIKTVRERHPDVEFEACAGGGARVDLGAMRYFDEYWTSDNTDAFDRLEIQRGYSLLYPAKYMRAWVTDVPDALTGRSMPLSFRMHCAMCGALGIGNNLNRMDEAELDCLKKGVSDYKRIRHIVQFGKLYRLGELKKDELVGVQYVNGEESVLFVFLSRCRYGQREYRFRMKGLAENKLYKVEGRDGEVVKSGAFLMHYGLTLSMSGDYDSQMIEVREIS